MKRRVEEIGGVEVDWNEPVTWAMVHTAFAALKMTPIGIRFAIGKVEPISESRLRSTQLRKVVEFFARAGIRFEGGGFVSIHPWLGGFEERPAGDEEAQAIELYRQGQELAWISSKLNVPLRRLHQILDDNDIPLINPDE